MNPSNEKIYLLETQRQTKISLTKHTHISSYSFLPKIGFETELYLIKELGHFSTSLVSHASFQNLIMTLHKFYPSFAKVFVCLDDGMSTAQCCTSHDRPFQKLYDIMQFPFTVTSANLEILKIRTIIQSVSKLRGVFRTKPDIQDRAEIELKAVHYLRKKAPLQTFESVLNTLTKLEII